MRSRDKSSGASHPTSRRPHHDAPGPQPGWDGRESLLLILDDAARILGCNPQACAFFGRDQAEMVGVAFADVFVADKDRAEFLRALTNQDPNTSSSGRAGWVFASGGYHQVLWRLDVFAPQPDAPRLFMVTGLDAKRSQLTSEREAEREARLQAVLDTAVDGIVTIDDKGIIESANLATERIFGYTPGEIIGRNVKVLMPAPYREEHDGYLGNYLKTGQKKIIGIGREVEGRRKDGTTFPLDLAVSEFVAEGTRRFMGLMRDISERKRAEQEARRHLDELAHASRLSALGEMATGIAHEVNQPLAAIVSYAQACLNMMSSQKADSPSVKEALEQIASQGKRAGDIIHQLRQLVRKEQGQRLPIDVNRCVENVAALFSHELKSSGVKLELRLAEELPDVNANRVQIEQVALNLLRNALDALTMQPVDDPWVALETRTMAGGGVELRITDNGPGLGGDDPARLFETFYSTKPQGLGVGLSISRSIIESHRGQLWAQQEPSGGLCVVFTLPGSAADEL